MVEIKDKYTNCFNCTDNKSNCGTCIDLETCTGCTVCETEGYEPCIHCKIECVHEQSCVYRTDWEIEIMSKRSKKNNLNNKVEADESIIPCATCLTRQCMTVGTCPEGVFEKLTQGETTETTLSKTSETGVKETPVKNTPKYKKYSPHGKVWDTGITCIDACHHIKEKIKLRLTVETYLKLEHLQKEFPDVEFLVYGNAEQQTDGIFLIKDIVVPKQTVAMASVDDVECDNHYNTVIHKHPGDTPGGFSHDDDEYVNLNHDFSLLIGSKDLSKIMGVGRKKTDCGKWMRVPLDINVEFPAISDKFFLSSVTNITKKVYGTTVYNQNIWDKRQKEVNQWYKERFY